MRTTFEILLTEAGESGERAISKLKCVRGYR
jgi:hypothetical protein